MAATEGALRIRERKMAQDKREEVRDTALGEYTRRGYEPPSDRVAATLFRGVEKTSSLKVLSVTRNRVGEHGTYALAQCFYTSKTDLRDVNLSGNNFNGDDWWSYDYGAGKAIDVVDVLPLPNRDEVKGPFPAPEEPSDHILLAATLRVSPAALHRPAVARSRVKSYAVKHFWAYYKPWRQTSSFWCRRWCVVRVRARVRAT